MTKSPRDKLAQLLVGSDRNTSHSASITMAAHTLELSVEGVGRSGTDLTHGNLRLGNPSS